MEGRLRWLIGCCLVLALCHGDQSPVPVIGIMSHPCTHKDDACQGNCEYLPASYVKFVELAGARAVPISYSASEEEVDDLLGQLNGVLFMGGAADLQIPARRLVTKVLEINDAGGHFPIWGTCLGFEWIADAVAGEAVIVEGFDSENLTLKLEMTAAANASRMFGDDWLREAMASNAVTFNSHHQGLDVSTFEANKKLRDRFRVLATNVDRQGRAFVSAMEAIDAPIYAVQYHPEKNIFEWGMDDDGTPHLAIPHSHLAVLASQAQANLFMTEARRNQNLYDLRREETFFENRATSPKFQPTFAAVYLFCDSPELNASSWMGWVGWLIASSPFLCLAAFCVVGLCRSVAGRARKIERQPALGLSLQPQA